MTAEGERDAEGRRPIVPASAPTFGRWLPARPPDDGVSTKVSTVDLSGSQFRRNLWTDDGGASREPVWHRARPEDRGQAGCSWRIVLNDEMCDPGQPGVGHLCRRRGCFPEGWSQ